MTWVSTHADDLSHRRIILLEWTIGGATYRWAEWDIPIVTSGTTGAPAARWTPFGFSVSGVSSRQSELSVEATISLGNADGIAYALISAAGGCAGTAIKIWEAWLDPNGITMVSQQETLLLSGVVNYPSITPETVELKTSPPAALQEVTIPRRIYSITGSAIFKSSLCGYVGAATSCDKLYATCLGLGNSTRFCGFYQLEEK